MAKILVIDDASSTLDALCELLGRAGHEAIPADSFEEGRRLASQSAPDLLIIDVRLGAYNGLQLVVRERFAHPQRPIIVTTGFPDPVLETEAKRYGVEFLEKPIRLSELLLMVQRLLPDSGSSPESADRPHAGRHSAAES